jgi:hypothetical protein
MEGGSLKRIFSLYFLMKYKIRQSKAIYFIKSYIRLFPLQISLLNRPFSTAHFSVIIVGGGIAGLTLVTCLQPANIDFVVLEGREKVRLHKGLGVGVYPCAACILDQLGVYANIEAKSFGTLPIRKVVYRNVRVMIVAEKGNWAVAESRCYDRLPPGVIRLGLN